MTEEKGVINAMLKIWSAYGGVLQHYGLAVAYTTAPFMMLVFFIVTAVVMAPVIVWYYLGYVLVWLVWIRRFFWLSIVVPEIAKITSDSSIKMGLSDMYLVSERLMGVDARGDGGIVAAIPILLLLSCTVAIIIFTAASLVLTLLDITGGRWETVEGQWELANKRIEAAEAETKEAAAKSPVVACLLYTSDAADEEDSVDLGGRRIIKKKKTMLSARRSSIKPPYLNIKQ
eukprot:TRINITY_DN10864_c0_g1_i1.p1 TRINITY_DN10864_c0_g1~~TRINITY_DN10864_c0_g1_i1.p1  ORF type:complete len:230 (-),score=51.63 TRINITY_DN10864_c0_g1_i1:18-707(-)